MQTIDFSECKKFQGYSKQEIAKSLGISLDRLRQIIRELKSLPEFTYRNYDKFISGNDYQIIMKFWYRSKQTSFNHAISDFRKYGININEH